MAYKFYYEAPQIEVIDIEVEGFLCMSDDEAAEEQVSYSGTSSSTNSIFSTEIFENKDAF